MNIHTSNPHEPTQDFKAQLGSILRKFTADVSLLVDQIGRETPALSPEELQILSLFRRDQPVVRSSAPKAERPRLASAATGRIRYPLRAQIISIIERNRGAMFSTGEFVQLLRANHGYHYTYSRAYPSVSSELSRQERVGLLLKEGKATWRCLAVPSDAAQVIQADVNARKTIHPMESSGE